MKRGEQYRVYRGSRYDPFLGFIEEGTEFSD
jgi:hypothetical protein